MCAGSPPVERRTNTRGAGDCAAISATVETATAILISHDLLDRLQHVGGLREDFLLEIRMVRDGRVERRDAANRRVEVLEELVGDARGDLGAESARQLVLVRDDDAVRLL